MAEEYKRPHFFGSMNPLTDLVQVPSGKTWHINRAWYKPVTGGAGVIVINRTDSADVSQENVLNVSVPAGTATGDMIRLTVLDGQVLTDQDKIRGTDVVVGRNFLFVLAVIERDV